MKSYIWFLLVVPALALGIGLCLGAPEGPGLAKGTVLILHTERTMEGDILRKGDVYCIRRGPGEVTVPAAKVLRLCQDWDDAVAFMKSRAQLGDPDERIRLAKWCHINNLPDYALIEADAACKMRPNNKEAQQFVEIFRRAAEQSRLGPSTPVEAEPDAPAAPQIDVTQDCLVMFTTKIQPILINTCVSCHSAGRGGAFQLVRTEAGQRAATQRNLIAAVSQINVDRPSASQLLIKALSPHGNKNITQAPIRGEQSGAALLLREWIELVVASNPHLKGWTPPTLAAPTTPPREPPSSIKVFTKADKPGLASRDGQETFGGARNQPWTEFGVDRPIVSTSRDVRLPENVSPQPSKPSASLEPPSAMNPERIPTRTIAPLPPEPEIPRPGFILAAFPEPAGIPVHMQKEVSPAPGTKMYPPLSGPSTSLDMQQPAAFPAEASPPQGLSGQVKSQATPSPTLAQAPALPQFPPSSGTPAADPVRAGSGRDVYDPELFNRQHSQK